MFKQADANAASGQNHLPLTYENSDRIFYGRNDVMVENGTR